MDTTSLKKIIINNLNDYLKPLGYKHKGNWYTATTNNDLTYYINLQSSTASTNQLLKITLNIEIASAKLAAFDDDRMPIDQRRHFTKRIGFYLDNPEDRWWTVSDENTANTCADEIIRLFEKKALPQIKEIRSTNDLVDLMKKSNTEKTISFFREKYIGFF
ncbi:DUF4304 domain-containing protein [Mucilaginibacter sp. HMF5004]|uniref:DUF4304 domain-containing protein n=1 Tax=Mucilaginibacter rivuli TaxID=2857527 RepID=UPI001C5D03FE|nr:DUF4304 domain-containing protein [Mucilaginibacter rivuli]MBW4890863.1 DUF4304 domain-containing protein [Mucilaginibacter rivuli]